MNTPQDNKPSLEELFESKKLDQPSDEFWENFQSDVRSKTLTSLAKDNSSRSLKNKIYLLVVIFSISLTSLHYLELFESNSATQDFVSDLDVQNVVFSKSLSIEKSENVDLKNPDFTSLDFDNEISDGLFVDQRYLASSLESSFHHRVLISNVTPDDISMVPFTF